MIRPVTSLLAAVTLVVASPVFAATKAAKPKAKPAAQSSVVEVMARAGAAGETIELRDLVAFDAQVTTNDWTAFAEQRAAIRACHAERYAAAKDNVLTGRSQPLREC